MSVVEFKRKDEPYQQGKAKCLKCKHEWQAVAPVGTWLIVCPECSCDGAFMGANEYEGERFVCNCGCDLFRIAPKACYCINCGNTAVFD